VLYIQITLRFGKIELLMSLMVKINIYIKIEKLKTFYEDVYELEKTINLRVEEGLHSLEVIRNDVL
jgi:hypothetical protein